MIDINTDCLLEEDQSEIFEAFSESTWQQRLFLFREAIAQRYGFVNSTTDKSSQPSSAIFSTFHQYVHATGNMFLLIPTQMKEELKGIQVKYFVKDVSEVLDCKNEPFFFQGIKGRQSVVAGYESGSLKRQRKSHVHHDSIGTDQDESINYSRELSDKKPSYDHSQTGFLWSWNFMISRKWKMTANTGATGDIPFMDKMLEDFRAFCRNDQDRLRRFWKQCWDVHNLSNEVQDAMILDHKAVQNQEKLSEF